MSNAIKGVLILMDISHFMLIVIPGLNTLYASISKKRKRFLCLLFLVPITALYSQPSIANNFNEEVDAIFSFINKTDSPGCTFGVIERGHLIHKAGYGLANLELGVELDGTMSTEWDLCRNNSQRWPCSCSLKNTTST